MELRKSVCVCVCGGGGGLSCGVEEVLGALGEGGVDDFKWRSGNGGGGSWFFSHSPPSLTSLSVPSQTPTSGGK